MFAQRLSYDRPIAASLEAFRWARVSTAEILDRLTDADWARAGTHTESGPYTVERWLEDHHRPADVVAFTGRPEYLPRLDPFCAAEVPATVDDLQARHPDLLVTNWHYSLRSRSE